MSQTRTPRIDSRHKTAAQGIRAGFTLVMALIILLGLIGIVHMNSVTNDIRRIIEVQNRKSQLAYEMVIASRERAMHLRALIDEQNPFERDAMVPRFHELAGVFRRAREEMLKLELSHEEYKLLKAQAEYTARGSLIQDEVLDLTLQDRLEEARDLFVHHNILQKAALDNLRQIANLQIRHNETASLSARERYRMAVVLLLLSGAVVLLLTGLIALFVSRRQAHLLLQLMAKEREQHRMNKLLAKANQDLQSQKTAMDEHAIVSIADTSGSIIYVNDNFCRISQYSREECMGRNHRLLKSDVHPQAYFDEIWSTILAGSVWSGEFCNRRKDGGLYWTFSTIVPCLDNDQLPYQFISITTDITERKQLEGSLIAANRDLQLRIDERTRALSQAMKQLEQDIHERQQGQQKLQQQFAELQALHRELQDTQSQLLQSEKMASVGQLAAGVAHEINNPIGYVHSNLGTLEGYANDLFRIIAACETIRDSAYPTPECQAIDELMRSLDLAFLKEDFPALIRESKEGISRVRKIVQDLKDFSRLDASLEWQMADLHAGLESTLNIVHNEIKYKAEVVKEYGDIPEVECLPSRLNQVFMNLLVNATQAIDQERGTITLRTGRIGDDKVFIEIADTGRGIPEAIRDKIFDPFFTTKPVGVGTGLGLSLAYGIIQKHQGRFELESEMGQGTTFRIILPVSQTQTSLNLTAKET